MCVRVMHRGSHMKKFISLMILAVALVTVQAQTQTPTNKATFTEEDKAAAKKELTKVGEMFGVKPTEKPVVTDGKLATEATMAKVADKALDMVGDAVGSIAGMVQKVAPEVWEIMVRQQYASALGMLIGPFLFLILVGLYTLITKKYWAKYPENEKSDARDARMILTSIIPGILALVFMSILAYRIGDAVPMLINPKYYAVKDLLQMLLK